MSLETENANICPHGVDLRKVKSSSGRFPGGWAERVIGLDSFIR
jgi:hypothetical protein